MFRNMVTSLFKHEQIQTTDVKAKELRRWADQLITLAKRGDLHARRQAMAIIREKDVVHKLFEEAPTRFADVNGGYTRIVKVGYRPGDAASVSLVQLISPDPKKKKKPRRKKKGAAAAETPMAVETKEAAMSESETAAGKPDVETAPEAPEADAAVEAAGAETTAAVEAKEAATPDTPTETAEPGPDAVEKKDQQ